MKLEQVMEYALRGARKYMDDCYDDFCKDNSEINRMRYERARLDFQEIEMMIKYQEGE